MRRRLLLLVLLILVAGCGRGSFIGGRLDNFTAYYNTFYNAEKSFDAGVKAIRDASRNQPINPDVYLPLFGSEDRLAQTQPFDDAIKKSADVLREHPDSKWIDDALLLIGKAYFYLQNYVGAEQKFQEVMGLGSRLNDEARFWLARTLIASGQYEAAAAHLQESLIREGRSKRWEPRLRLALGALHVRRGAWEEAAQELAAGLEDARDNDLGARAQFLLGQVYETLKRYDQAVAAYDRVASYNPIYELSYAAQFSAVRVEGLHGDPEAGLRKLRRMERDDKNYANRAELAYLRGRIYQAMGRAEDALDTYYGLLYDSDANITNVRGRTHYALGSFYRDVYHDYPLAAAYFDTAATALRGGSRAPTGGATVTGTASRPQDFAPAAIIDSEDQARTFGSFARVEGQISHMDSLLYLGSLDEEAFKEVVLELRRRRAEELAAQRLAMERRQAEQFFASGEFDNLGLEQGAAVNRNTAATTQTGSAGFLFHKDAARVQDGLVGFEQRWGRRPLVPNWRRLEAVSGVSSAAGTEGVPESVAPLDAEDVGLPEVDVTAVPRDSLGQAQMRAQRAVARYELGNVLFLSMERPDSAAVWYRKVIEDDADEPVAQRAYYALAEVQRALGDTLAARRLYQTILDRYPQSDFAGRASERLGLQQEQAAASDSLALAEAAYGRAYQDWQREAFAASLNEMVEVAARYRATDVAPRALLAAGAIYMAWSARDSLALFDPLPLMVPDSLLRLGGLLKDPVDAVGETTLPDLPQAADSLGLNPPSMPLPADSLMLRVDTLAARAERPLLADSLGAGADSLARAAVPAADTVAAPKPEPVRLETLYATLVERYPRAPQVRQAQRILKALDERRRAMEAPSDTTAAPVAEVLPDSAAAPVAPTPDRRRQLGQTLLRADDVPQEPADPAQQAPADTAAVRQQERLRDLLDERQTLLRQRLDPSPDSLGTPEQDDPSPRPDTLAAPADSSRAEADGVAEPGGIPLADRNRGGWTIVVGTPADEQQAAVLARNFRYVLRNERYAVDVFPAALEGGVSYRVGAGWFATRDEAADALTRLQGRVPGDAWLLEIPPASDGQ